MFNILVNNSGDHRRLLLDYSKYESPLKKNFPCEGVDEYYYDIFNQQAKTTKINSIEL
jgi:NADH:ubiquinone oxidoreductase subunit C